MKYNSGFEEANLDIYCERNTYIFIIPQPAKDIPLHCVRKTPLGLR